MVSLFFPIKTFCQLFLNYFLIYPITISSICFPDIRCPSPIQLALHGVIFFKPTIAISEIVICPHANKYPITTSATSIRKNTNAMNLSITTYLPICLSPVLSLYLTPCTKLLITQSLLLS